MNLTKTKFKDNDNIADIVIYQLMQTHTIGQDNTEWKEHFAYWFLHRL